MDTLLLLPSNGATLDTEVTWDRTDQLSLHLLNTVGMSYFVETDFLTYLLCWYY